MKLKKFDPIDAKKSPKLANLICEKEAATILGTARKTLQRWRSTGEGPAFIKIGSLARYEPAAIRQFIDERRCSSTADVSG